MDAASSPASSPGVSITAKIRKFTTKVTQVQKQVKEIGGPKDSAALRTRIQKSTDEAFKLESEIKNVIKEGKGMSKTVIDAIESSFKGVQKTFKEVMDDKEHKESEFKIKAERSQSTSSEDDEEGPMKTLAEDPEQAEFESKLIKLDMDALDQEIGLQQEKNKDLKALGQDLEVLHDTFKEFNDIVVEQGEAIDTIQDNVRLANENVVAGTAELKEAGEIQKDLQSKTKYIYIGLAVAGIAIIAISLLFYFVL